jgi:hypothetical protein
MLINFRWKWCRRLYRDRSSRASRMLCRWQRRFVRAQAVVLEDLDLTEEPPVFRGIRPRLRDCIRWSKEHVDA